MPALDERREIFNVLLLPQVASMAQRLLPHYWIQTLKNGDRRSSRQTP
jgi:hypothetical protein